MNKLIQYSTLAAALLASAHASAAATVTFVNPGDMTDVPRFHGERESMEADLQDHFNTLANRLPAGQQLQIEILDIDLAGDVFPRVAIQNVRVMQGRADWPRIHLRYTIVQDGQVVRSGERRLSDMNYMSGFKRYNNELFGHEKQLLDDWFRKDIVASR